MRQTGVVSDDGPTLDEIHAEEERQKAAQNEIESELTEDVLVAAEAGEAISEIAEEEKAVEEDHSVEETPSADLDYSSMTVAELKEILKERGLPVSGKKADLIERLTE